MILPPKKKTPGEKKFNQLIADLTNNTHFQYQALAWYREKDYKRKDELLWKVEMDYGITEDQLSKILQTFDDTQRFITIPKSIDMCQIEQGYGLYGVPESLLSPDRPDTLYPLGIRIHRYASQKDVIDFVKKHWKSITEIMNKSYAKKRSLEVRKYTERDDFIFQHKDLPAKQILQMLKAQNEFEYETGGTKGHPLSSENIRKIIEVEKKRRMAKM